MPWQTVADLAWIVPVSMVLIGHWAGKLKRRAVMIDGHEMAAFVLAYLVGSLAAFWAGWTMRAGTSSSGESQDDRPTVRDEAHPLDRLRAKLPRPLSERFAAHRSGDRLRATLYSQDFESWVVVVSTDSQPSLVLVELHAGRHVAGVAWPCWHTIHDLDGDGAEALARRLAAWHRTGGPEDLTGRPVRIRAGAGV